MSDKAKVHLMKSLVDAMSQWNEDNCETDHWLEVGFIGDNLAVLMATAAFAVFQGSASGHKAHVDNS